MGRVKTKPKLKEFVGKHRKKVILITAFLVVPTVVNITVMACHPRMMVGIVLVDNCHVKYARIAKEGFDHHHRYFAAKVIDDYRFDSRDVRIKGELLLTTDFYNKARAKDLCDRYDVDVILYVTDKKINNWDQSERGAWWGQADLETSSAVMTVHYFMTPREVDRNNIRSIAVHEVGHLLGLIHPPRSQCRECVMDDCSSVSTLEFNSYYKATMPFHLTVYKLGHGYPIGTARDGRDLNMAFVKMLVSLFFLPYMILATVGIFRIVRMMTHVRKLQKGAKIVTMGTAFFTYTTLVYSFVYIALVVILAVLFVVLCNLEMMVRERFRVRKRGVVEDGSGR